MFLYVLGWFWIGSLSFLGLWLWEERYLDWETVAFSMLLGLGGVFSFGAILGVVCWRYLVHPICRWLTKSVDWNKKIIDFRKNKE